MNLDLLSIRTAPPAPPPAPWCAGYVAFDDGPIVAVLWWDDRPLDERGVRQEGEAGVLGEAPVGPDADLPEPGWHWWVVGAEAPWCHDPRITVARVECVGPGTPTAAALTLFEKVLADLPDPDFSYEQSVEMIGRRLPWFPAEAAVAEAIESDESIGSGIVIDQDPDR